MATSHIELLQRLVSFDTTSSKSNLAIVDFLCDYLDAPNVHIERQPSPDGTKANVVISAGPLNEARTGLCMSGHLDVVPARERGWVSPPFSVTERDGRLFGRGTCDMKGFIAVAVNVFRAWAARRTLSAPVALVLTYDEEVGTLGAKHLVESFPNVEMLPRNVVIGEPTNLQAVRAHKGHLKIRLKFSGKSAHSGMPHLGENAIDLAATAMIALKELSLTMAAESPESGALFRDTPYEALHVARVNGGTALNVIPDACTVDVGIRTLPDSSHTALVERVRTHITNAVGERPFDVELLGHSPAMVLDPNSTMYRHAIQSGCEHLHAAGAPFATDAGWLQTVGFETILFGPGDMAVAHRPNEYVDPVQLDTTATMLNQLIHYSQD